MAKARKTILPDIGKLSGARTGLLPVFLEPSLASPCEKPPSGPKWIHEIKYDGYRMQARIDGRTIRLLTRKKLDWTERFRSIADALQALGLGSALIDGEIVVEDASGISSFNNLQADLKAGRLDRFRYFVFDILYCEGFDLTKAVLKDRKELLQQLLAGLPAGSPIRFSEHLDVDGPTMLEHSCRLGLEGIISKRVDLPYRSGRGDHWLKSKCVERQEFVILGYIPSTVSSRSVGSLALGYHDRETLFTPAGSGQGGPVTNRGRCVTNSRKSVRQSRNSQNRFRPASRKASDGPSRASSARSNTAAGRRTDCSGRRRSRGLGTTGLPRKSFWRHCRSDRNPGVAPAPIGIHLTHPERILWEEAGITKQGLAEFYTDIADWILPHIAGRPLSLLRCPSGTGAKCFFAKHPWQGLDASVRRIDTGDKEPMVAVDELAGLMCLVQAGVVEIHPWGSTVDHLEQPDRLIFDLDPGENVPWTAVIEAARDVRDRLVALGLQSFVKTSGGKGLHVVVPVEPEPTGTTLRRSPRRLPKRWPRRDQTVTSPQSRSAHAALASLSIICGTAAVPPRLQHIRRGRCRERRFRHPSIGTNFHPDFVRTTSQSGTCCIGFHLSNKILGQGIFKIRQQLPQFQ